jgi:soluble lytic murein transglycosylase-like protein
VDAGRCVTIRSSVRLAAVFTFVCAVLLSAGVSRAGTFWVRERAGGIVEFTNKTPPSGGRWKVWLKNGPGKAAALRGSTDIVPARDRSATRLTRYDQHIHDQQALYGIPEALVRAVIKTESDYDPGVVSSAGAQGLMQLMPDTARLMGVTDAFDPRQNIMGGCRYLQVLARRFCKTSSGAGIVCTPDEKVKIVAGYHAGPGAVEKYGGIPPYETTHAYVAAVMRRYVELSRAVGGGGGEAP